MIADQPIIRETRPQRDFALSSRPPVARRVSGMAPVQNAPRHASALPRSLFQKITCLVENALERLVRFSLSVDISPIPNAQDQDIVVQNGIDYPIVTHAHLA